MLAFGMRAGLSCVPSSGLDGPGELDAEAQSGEGEAKSFLLQGWQLPASVLWMLVSRPDPYAEKEVGGLSRVRALLKL
jgi:hypothetical protein